MALDGAPEMTVLIRSPRVDKSGGLSSVSSEYELGGGWTIGELSVVRSFCQSRPQKRPPLWIFFAALE